MPLEKFWLLQPALEHHWRDYNSPHTPRHIKQSSIHASLKWQDGGTPSNKWIGLWKFSFYLEFTALRCIPVLLFKHGSTSISLCTCFGYELHYSFCVLQRSSNSSGQTSCIRKGLHAGKWPDLKTSKPDAVSTLGYHRTDYTGATLADAITQWSSSGNTDSELITCITGTHWKTTGATSTLGCHWNYTGWC